MAAFIPDCTSSAEALVDAVAGLVAAGRRDLAVAHARTTLRIMWGGGCSVGFGESIEIDKAAAERAASRSAGRG